MSAHDTPEVGSGETAGEWQGCDFGCTTHDCAVRCDAGSDPSEDVWNERTRHWYCPLGNDNCGAHTPASPDPVQPADAGEGLNLVDALTKVMHQELPTVLSHIGAYRLATAVLAAGFRPGSTYDDLREAGWLTPADLAAHEAAWAEKYAAAVGERDEMARRAAWWERTCIYWNEQATEAQRFRDMANARIDAAEAALATALREKAEVRGWCGRPGCLPCERTGHLADTTGDE